VRAQTGLPEAKGAHAPPEARPGARFTQLDSLRAFAVFAVIVSHTGPRVLEPYALGMRGVQLFFVLSGFLITGILLAGRHATASRPDTLRAFYCRRFLRIFPAYYSVLLITLIIGIPQVRQGIGWHLAYLSNVRAARLGSWEGPVSHLWSLSVEEQFYLVWPAVLSVVLFGIAFTRRRHHMAPRNRRLLLTVVVLGGISLGWSVHMTATLPLAAYFSPLTRAWELGIGAALAVGASAFVRVPAAIRLLMGWAGLVAIAAAAVLFSETTPFPGLFALIPTVGTALAIAAGIGDQHSRVAAGRLLAVRPMCFLGDRSYAIYLWHWPILILAAQYVGHGLSLPAKLGLVAAALLLSCVSFALVENPIRRKTHSRRAAALVFAVSLAAVLATATVSLAAIRGEQQRFGGIASSAPTPVLSSALRSYPTRAGAQWALPEVVAAVRAARRGDPLPSDLTPPVHQLRAIPPQYALPKACMSRNASSSSTSRLCRFGERTSRRLIVLIGDSHAWMWLPTVLEVAWRDGWAVVPLIRTGCMPNRWVTNEGPEGCRGWYRWATSRVRLLHPEVTLVGGSIGEEQTSAERAATDGIIAMATSLKPVGRIIVIGDPEGLSASPVDCLLASNASMASCTTAWPPDALQGYDRVAARTRQAGVGFIATRGFFCFDRQCPAVIGSTIAYSDNSHITAVYAGQLTDAFRAGFRRALLAPR
jgi:peptidoglycan/LPS O-acetylase OafA/YrhL